MSSYDTTKPLGNQPSKKIDEESKLILQYISEDFVILTGSTPVAYHIESGDQLGEKAFKIYCAKHYGEIQMVIKDKDGNETSKRIDSGDIWWAWNDHERRVVRRIVMEPTSEKEDYLSETFNRWYVLRQTMAVPDMSATQDAIGILIRHLMFISGGDVVGVTYFLNWLAQLYQFPDSKIPSAILLYSKFGGVGKSILYKLLAAVFGKPLVVSCTGAAINKSFDDIVEHRRIVFIEEMARSDKTEGYERFKDMVSGEDGAFEGKGRAAKQVRNIAHYVVTTNNADALPLMDQDRRVLVLRCEAQPQPPEYYEELGAWIDGDGPALLAGVLAQWKFAKDWKYRDSVPQTEATRLMQRESRGDLAMLVDDLIERGLPPFDRDFVAAGEACVVINGNPAHRGQISRDANLTSLGKVLRARCGDARKTRVTVKGKCESQWLFFCRNAEQWTQATPEQRGHHLEHPGAPRLFPVQQAEVVDHE